MTPSGDGALDLLITQNNLPPLLLKNDGGNRYNWLRLAFKGEHDNKTGDRHQSRTLRRGAAAKMGSPRRVRLPGSRPRANRRRPGRRARKRKLFVCSGPPASCRTRMRFPRTRNEHITEIDRRGSSCPIVFVWNGEKFEFLADMIGPGIVGHWTGPNQRNIPNPDGIFQSDRLAGAAARGPPAVSACSNRWKSSIISTRRACSPWIIRRRRGLSQRAFRERAALSAQFKVIASRNAHLPVGAWDDQGPQSLAFLREQDHKYVTNFPARALRWLRRNAQDRAGPRRLGIPQTRCACSWTASPITSAPVRCTLRGKRASRRCRLTSKCRTAPAKWVK